MKIRISQDDLKKLVSYDADTGKFTLTESGLPVKETKDSKGYVIVSINRRTYSAHRLAWLYVHGRLPKEQIDHINRIKDDNRLVNLREATNAQNAQNRDLYSTNSSGYVGVSFNKKSQKYEAYITLNGKRYRLGHHELAEDAANAYKQAKDCLHTFYSMTNGHRPNFKELKKRFAKIKIASKNNKTSKAKSCLPKPALTEGEVMKTKVQLTKAQAIEIFGSREAMDEALENSKHAMGRWPDPLTVRLTQRVVGAAWLAGKVRQIKKVLGL